MNIYIVRHGVAEDVSSDGTDGKRALTAEGRKKMKEAAAGFAALENGIGRIVSSPLVRAWQTAEILANILGNEVEEMRELAPGHSPKQVLNRLIDMQDADGVMLAGHQPDCSELASYLLGSASVEFKKGAICKIQIDRMTAGAGILIWHLTPQALRLMRK